MKAIENSANADQAEEIMLDSRADCLSGSMVKSSESISEYIFPQNLQKSLNSVTLTYFDRKAFFLSISRFFLTIIVLLLTIIIGNFVVNREHSKNDSDMNSKRRIDNFNRYSDAVEKDYYKFIEKNLPLHQKYPQILEQAAGEFNVLDNQLTDIIGQIYRIQREINN